MRARLSRRGAIVILAATILAAAGCRTEPATDVGWDRATLHGSFTCQQGSYDVTAWFELRRTGAANWAQAGPAHPVSCRDEPGQSKPLPATPVTGLEDATGYEYRLHAPDGHWYDSRNGQDGTNYDHFTTAAHPTVDVASAKRLRDSIGINTRTAYQGTPHADCARVLAALRYMGIRFIRDGAWPTWETHQRQCYRDFQAAGVKATLGFGDMDDGDDNQCDGPAWTKIDQNIASYRADPQLRAFVDQLDGANEPDYYEAIPGWPDCVRSHQRNLFEEAAGEWKVVGPSFVGSGQLVGDLSPWIDFADYHPYQGGERPGPNLDRQRGSCTVYAPAGEPCRITEVGYHADIAASGHDGVSQAVRAPYTLRLLLEAYLRDSARVDLYTIVEQWCNPGNGSADSADFGFYDCNWQPYPVADALHNLTAALGDGGTAGAYKLAFEESPADLRSACYRQADGDIVVALWRDVSIWDRDAKRQLDVAAAQVRLSVPAAAGAAAVRPVDSANEQPLAIQDRRVTVSVAGDPVLVVLR